MNVILVMPNYSEFAILGVLVSELVRLGGNRVALYSSVIDLRMHSRALTHSPDAIIAVSHMAQEAFDIFPGALHVLLQLDAHPKHVFDVLSKEGRILRGSHITLPAGYPQIDITSLAAQLRYSDLVICPNRFVMDSVQAYYPSSRDKTECVSLYVSDLPRIFPEISLSPLRSGKTKTVTCFGGDYVRSGLLHSINTVKLVNNQLLQGKQAPINMEHNTGPFYLREALLQLSQCDVFSHPTCLDGLDWWTFLAATLGIPTLVSRFGGFSAHIRWSHAHVLEFPPSPERYASAARWLREVVSSPQRMEACRFSALQSVLALPSVNTVATILTATIKRYYQWQQNRIRHRLKQTTMNALRRGP